MSIFKRKNDNDEEMESNEDAFSKKLCTVCEEWTKFIIRTGESDEIVEECTVCGDVRKQKIIGNLTTPMRVYERYVKWKNGELTDVSPAEEQEFMRIKDEEEKQK